MNLWRVMLIFWLRLCQILGLVLVEYDKTEDRFYLLKFSTVYSATIGIFVSTAFVVSLMKFSALMASNSILAIAALVGKINLSVFFGGLVLSYQQIFTNRNKVLRMLNNFIVFYRKFEKYQLADLRSNVNKYNRSFCISLCVKVVMYVINFSLFNALLGNHGNILGISISIPRLIVSLNLCQFNLGILLINNILRSMNQKVCELAASPNMSPNQLENFLLKVSEIHSKLFKLLRNLSYFFGYQLTCTVFIHCSTLSTVGFQVVNLLVLFTEKAKVSFHSENLASMGFVMILMTSVDTIYQLRIFENCVKLVSQLFSSNFIKSKISLLSGAKHR